MNQVVPVEQKVVNFDGAEIMAVKANDGKVYAGIRWICDGLSMTEGQRKNQMTKIQEDPVLRKGGRKIVLPSDGGPQEALCLALDYLPLWLAKRRDHRRPSCAGEGHQLPAPGEGRSG